MDPASIIGVVAAALQFIDFGTKVLGMTFRERDPNDNDHNQNVKEDLIRHAEQMAVLSEGVKDTWDMFSRQNPVAATPAQDYFAKVCIECKQLELEFQEFFDEARRHIDHKRKKHPRKGRGGRIIMRLQNRNPFIFNVDVNAVRTVRERFDSLMKQVTTGMIYCIWEDTKHIRGKELQFHNRIEKAVQRLEGMASADMNDGLQQDAVPTGSGGMVQISSFYRMKDEVTMSLNARNTETTTLREEAMTSIRRRSWKLRDSTTQDDSPPSIASEAIGPQDIAAAIAESVGFPEITDQENEPPEAVGNTYSWIFEQPRERDGRALWDSFPDWVLSESQDLYWVKGKPACGKSTMIRSLTEKESARSLLSTWAGSTRLVVAGYFASTTAKVPFQRCLDGLKRSIIYWALLQVPELARSITPRRWTLYKVLGQCPDFPSLKAAELQESFEALLKECRRKHVKLALFVDGLDEFKEGPRSVLEILRHIQRGGASGIKLCVGSRPSTEFSDDFSRRGLKSIVMDRHTEPDIQEYVTLKLREDPGFEAMRRIRGTEVDALEGQVVQKAGGVFLWVKIVIDKLREALQFAASIEKLQEIVDDLPEGLSRLYDTIWKTIPEQWLRSTATMMQVLDKSGGPISWQKMWLISGLTDGNPENPNFGQDQTGEDWSSAAQDVLQRRLQSRTSGLLEMTPGLKVDFIHRNVRDWAAGTNICDVAASLNWASSNPFMCLVQAETLLLSKSWPHQKPTTQEMWQVVNRTLSLASEASETVGDSDRRERALVSVLDAFDNAVMDRYRSCIRTPSMSTSQEHWSTVQVSPDQPFLRNSFVGLAAQFSIYPYVKVKVSGNLALLDQSFSDTQVGLLENAMLGHKNYIPINEPGPGALKRIPSSRRLATVRFLLDSGLRQPKVHSKGSVTTLKRVIQREKERERQRSRGRRRYYFTELDALLKSYSGLSGHLKKMLSNFPCYQKKMAKKRKQ